MNTERKPMYVWMMASGLTVILGSSLVAARPGGGGGETPCYVNNPAYTTACSHWTDHTNPEECPDVTSGPNDPCPGVMEGSPGANSMAIVMPTSCHIIQKYWDTQTNSCVTTEFDQPISCTQPAGLTCQ